MKKRKLITLFLLVIFICIFFYWQNNDIITTSYNYVNSKITDELNGFRIIHISDLHNKKFGRNQRVLLKEIKKSNPNVIVVTGDIVDSRKTDISTALSFIKGACKIAPVYYVTGNHEYRLSQDELFRLMQGMKQYGATLLDNRVIHITIKNNKGLNLIGLSDLNLSDDTLNTLHASTDPKQLSIVLAHEPHYFDLYKQANVDLILSGHAHGGQFRLPFLGALIAPNQGFFPKYTTGPYIDENTTMIVSRGLGNSIIPIRIFNRPELVIITLSKEAM